MPRFAANLSFLFTELSFLDRFAATAETGFRGVEFTFPYEWPADDIKARLDAHGLEQVLFNLPPGNWAAGERGLTALTGREAEFSTGLDEALRYAEILKCSRLHAMAGLVEHGANAAVYRSNLAYAAARAAERGIEILIEPINTRDMPGYFLNRTGDAADIIAAVGAPNLGLQFDLYHRHIMEGGVEEALATYRPITRHYQAASPPDRGEPDRGELDFATLFSRIDQSEYTGWVGLEYKPRAETRAGLSWLNQFALGSGGAFRSL